MTKQSGVDKFVKFQDDPRIEKQMPHRQFEYVDAYFPLANVDVQIPYRILRPEFPTDVRWLDVRAQSVYDTTAIAHPQGQWIDVPFNAANFTGQGGMTWTIGNVPLNKYVLNGSTMTWQLNTNNNTIGGVAAVNLHVTIPAGLSATAAFNMPCSRIVDGGGAVIDNVSVNSGGVTQINIFKNSFAVWTLGAGHSVNFQLTFEVTTSTVADQPALIYASTVPSAQKAGEGYVVLRSTVAGYRTRLQLFIER